jgi:hypothetical protein
MLWKIYVWIFAAVNVLSLVSFQYSLDQYIGLISLIFSVGLNIAAFSYAYNKPVFSKRVLNWLFKLNIGLYGLFFLFEFITFFQEAIGVGISLPTSGFVSVLASFPSLPALYATYILAYSKTQKKKSKRKA